jgi:hypothetical protein
MKTSRRRWLQGASAGLLSLPLAHLIQPEEALAAPEFPHRLLNVFYPNGNLTNYWRPKPEASSLGYTLAFENSIMGPLQTTPEHLGFKRDFRDKICILDGLDHKVLYEIGAETGHNAGPCTAFTGSDVTSNPATPKTPSIDQAVAEQIGKDTKFRSLELGVFNYMGYGGDSIISFDANGKRRPFELDPVKVYHRLFADFVDDADVVQRRLQRRQSVLDYLVGDLARWKNRLGNHEKQKLDAHLTSLREIEKRLSIQVPSCQPSASGKALDLMDSNQIPALIQTQIDLIVQAFACGLTRVCSLQLLTSGGGAATMPWLGETGSIHENIAHQVGSAENDARFAKIQAFYHEMLAYLLYKLESIQEGDATLLDHTLVVWTTEFGHPGEHSNLNVPFVLAGGGFQMGRHLKYSQSQNPYCDDEVYEYNDCDPYFGYQTAHNHLLVSIAQLFGINTNTFGHSDYVGTLQQLLLVIFLEDRCSTKNPGNSNRIPDILEMRTVVFVGDGGISRFSNVESVLSHQPVPGFLVCLHSNNSNQHPPSTLALHRLMSCRRIVRNDQQPSVWHAFPSMFGQANHRLLC